MFMPKRVMMAIASSLILSANAYAGDCPALQGTWSNPVGGTWSFGQGSGKLVLNSSNFGSRAQQITELDIVSCDGGNLTFIVTRAKMVNTDDPEYAYDKAPPKKESSTPYSLSGDELKIGNFTYVKR